MIIGKAWRVLSLLGKQITAGRQGTFMGKWRLKGKKKLRKNTDNDKEIRGYRQEVSFMRGKQRFCSVLNKLKIGRAHV